MVPVITPLKVWQLYHVESLHPSGHSMTAAVVRAMIREALISSKVHINIILKADFSFYQNMRVVIVAVCGNHTKCCAYHFHFMFVGAVSDLCPRVMVDA
jgi:hypothetical protein